jgi:prepilin-type N-terminal cleavage/methylation domain-containing protein
MIQQLKAKRDQQSGFTLIELLIAIVVIGVLAAVVIIGIGSLTNKGEASACKASADAASAAAIVHYANNSAAYPADFNSMVTAKELVLPSAAAALVAGDTTVEANGWVLTLTPVAGDAPTFTCVPA